MKALLATAALGFFATLGLPATAAAATGFDQDPLLVIRFDTVTITGQKIESQAVIHTGGATEIVDVLEGRPGTAITSRGNPEPATFAELQRALAEGRVALERGGCGDAAPDGPVEYQVTWYGRGGGRFNSFRVGGNPNDCPESTRRIMEALFGVFLEILTSPETEVFPRF